MSVLKRAYVSGVRCLRPVAKGTGALRWLERHRDRKICLWARSLFAIYDIDDLTGLDLPWWTLDSARIVDGFLRARQNAKVFEYGSGASTVWLARRAGHVSSVEHDRAWAAQIAPHLQALDNIDYKVIEPGYNASTSAFTSDKPGWVGADFTEYVNCLEAANGPFDLIVIDGRCRSQCLTRALHHIADDGLIVFDNSARRRYQSAIASCGKPVQVTRGLTACLPYPDTTSLIAEEGTL